MNMMQNTDVGMPVFVPVTNDFNNPLVSILVYNYNYGRYLEECLESIVSQTYTNIEILFSDNASTDDSWVVALAFVKKHPGRMTITRNSRNLGPYGNYRNCELNVRGAYCISLGSDDVLMPEYIERCVQTFKENPDIGFVMVHYAVIDGEGQRREEPSFYNQSCVIQSEEQAAVYMMSSVSPSISQVMYHKMRLDQMASDTGVFLARWFGGKIQDFNLSTQHPIAYIKEPLLLFRIHGKNDSLAAGHDLLEVLGPYLLNLQFAETASLLNLNKVVDRLPQATDKLSLLSLRYCVRHLVNNEDVSAKRYFHLAPALNPDVLTNELYLQLEIYWSAENDKKTEILNELKETNDLVARSVSYDPPPGSISL